MFGNQPYNYESFNRRQLLSNFSRSWSRGPKPGEKAPDLQLRSLAGDKIRLKDFRGKRNVVLSFGSATCAMTAGSIGGLNGLYRRFGDEVEFLFVYVREAHPGDVLPAHSSNAEKAQAAKLFAEEEDVEMPVLVDELDGGVHRDYGGARNPSYLIDKSGRVAFRMLWTQPKTLRDAIKELLEVQERRGVQQAVVRSGEDRSLPVRYGLLYSHRALRRGGSRAIREFRETLGPGGRVVVAGSRMAQPILSPGKVLIGAGLAVGVMAAGIVGGMLLRKRRLDRMRQPYYYPRRTARSEPSDYEVVGI
jgi:hypothetical protein